MKKKFHLFFYENMAEDNKNKKNKTWIPNTCLFGEESAVTS